jgi:glycosyltransferase involved in cell wall biosynthesis
MLVVGHYFLRTRSAGGHRLQALVKYLVRRGWDVTVLTVAGDATRSGEPDDDAVFRFIPSGTRVVQTRSLEIGRFLKPGGSPQGRVSDKMDEEATGEPVARARRWEPSALSLWRTSLRWALGILNFPDRQIGWFIPLLVNGFKLLKRYRFDVVLSSSPPHSCHLPLVFLKNCFKFFWVCDFRDPWTDPPFYALDVNTFSVRRVPFLLNRLLEKNVLRSCDRVLANTPGNAEALRRSFGTIVQGKVAVLTNGFDDEIVAEKGTLDESALNCDFVFTGDLYNWMLDLYLRALESLRARGRRVPVLHIFGGVDDELRDKVRQYGFEEQILFKGPVAYEQSLWILSHANALLLLFIRHTDVFKHSVPSKLYAYIFSGRPYLALVPEGDASQILREVGGGMVVNSSDSAEVATAIELFLGSLSTDTGPNYRDQEAVLSYSWSNLSSRLDELIRTALGQGSEESDR